MADVSRSEGRTADRPMLESGRESLKLARVFFGVEAASDEQLRGFSKRNTVDKNSEAIHRLRVAGLAGLLANEASGKDIGSPAKQGAEQRDLPRRGAGDRRISSAMVGIRVGWIEPGELTFEIRKPFLGALLALLELRQAGPFRGNPRDKFVPRSSHGVSQCQAAVPGAAPGCRSVPRPLRAGLKSV